MIRIIHSRNMSGKPFITAGLNNVEKANGKKVKFTQKQYITDISRCEIGTEEYTWLSRFRAGVEGVPSVLRRMYNIDRIPVRGLNRSRIWVDAKIMAYNFRAFYAYCRRAGLLILSLGLLGNTGRV